MMSLFISLSAEFGVAGLLPLPGERLISLVGESAHCHLPFATFGVKRRCAYEHENNLLASVFANDTPAP